ncbi:MAG: hypothetical protein ACR2LX_14650 [Jatrophihabitans sp.]
MRLSRLSRVVLLVVVAFAVAGCTSSGNGVGAIGPVQRFHAETAVTAPPVEGSGVGAGACAMAESGS